MNDKAALLTLRVNAAILIVFLICGVYFQYRLWAYDQIQNQPPINFSQQELLKRVDDLVKEGRPLGADSIPSGHFPSNFNIVKLKAPLTATQRAILDQYLAAKEKDPTDTNIWDIKDASIDYAQRKTTSESVTFFIFEFLIAMLPAVVLLLTLATRSCQDSYRLWAYRDRYRRQPLTTTEAVVSLLAIGAALCTAGYIVVVTMAYDQPDLIKNAVYLNPAACFFLFTIYKNCLFTRLMDSTDIAVRTWWFIY
jgi:hypothetical protein